jgi:hypothetical protein
MLVPLTPCHPGRRASASLSRDPGVPEVPDRTLRSVRDDTWLNERREAHFQSMGHSDA